MLVYFCILVSIFSQWNMELEKVFDLEDLSRNTGSSDRYSVNEYVVLEDFYFVLTYGWLQL